MRLRNPMSEEQSTLRTTLLGSLLDGVRRNRSRGLPDVRLFEVGAIYLDAPRPDEPRATAPLPDEHTMLAALLTGALRPASWREPAPPRADFFAAKGVLEADAAGDPRRLVRRAGAAAVPAPRAAPRAC